MISINFMQAQRVKKIIMRTPTYTYLQPDDPPRRTLARFIVQKRNASDKLLPAMGSANCSPVCLLLEGNDRRR